MRLSFNALRTSQINSNDKNFSNRETFFNSDQIIQIIDAENFDKGKPPNYEDILKSITVDQLPTYSNFTEKINAF